VWEQGCLTGAGKDLLEGFIIDITEKREAQEALREREAFLSRILTTSPAGIGVVSSMTLSWVNDKVCRMLGYERDELLGLPVRDLFTSDEVFENARKHVFQMLSQQHSLAVEMQLRRKDGSLIDVINHLTASYPEDPEREVTFALLDISERKKAQEALYDRELHFRTLYEQAPIGIGLVGLDYVFEDLNPAFERYLGYSRAEMAGLDFREVTHADDIEGNLRLLDSLLAGDAATFRIEKQFVRKDGSIVDAFVVGTLIRDVHGKPLHFLSQVLDITTRKQAEAEVRRMNQDLEERVRQRTVELEAANEDLRRFAKLAAGREIRMAELKQEIRELRAEVEAASGMGGDFQ